MAYPVVIDHDSTSDNFETTDDSAYLYFTEWNDHEHCGQAGTLAAELDRDLVRVPISFSKGKARLVDFESGSTTTPVAKPFGFDAVEEINGAFTSTWRAVYQPAAGTWAGFAEYYGTNNGSNPPTPPPGTVNGSFDVLWADSESVQYTGVFMLPANAQSDIAVMQWDNIRIQSAGNQDYGGIVMKPQNDYPRTFVGRLVRGRVGGAEEDVCAPPGAGGCQPFVLPAGRWVYIWVWQFLGDGVGENAGNYVLISDGVETKWAIWANGKPNTYGRAIDRIRFGLTPYKGQNITGPNMGVPIDNIGINQP